MTETTTVEKGTGRWSAQEWAHWVSLFEQSGQKLKEFCRAKELAPSTFSYWRRRLREAERAGSAGQFVELRAPVVPTSSLSGAMRIGVPGGIWMEVQEGTDASWLAGVVRALTPSAK